MIYHVTIGKRTFEVDLAADGVRVDGREVAADMAHVDGTPLHNLLLDGASYRLVAKRIAAGRWGLHMRGRRLEAEVLDERMHAIRAMTGAGAGPVGPRPVRAPMPGLVVRLEVQVGDVVQTGQGIAIVEAMKMENELKAEGPGRVKGIQVSEGDTVDKDQVLVDFESLDEEGSA